MFYRANSFDFISFQRKKMVKRHLKQPNGTETDVFFVH